MRYFVIHSGSDMEKSVKPLIEYWAQNCTAAQFIILNGTQETWEADAVAKIRQAEKVIYIVGKNSHASPNIEKEIGIALKERKFIYVVKLNGKYILNRSVESLLPEKIVAGEGDADGEVVIRQRQPAAVVVDERSMLDHLRGDEEEVLWRLRAKNADDKETFFEQYKMFVQTSEELVKRKQSVNSVYITLNSIILGAIVSVMCALSDLPMLFGAVNVSLVFSVFAALIGSVVCFSWLSVLRSYADLNASKMRIIEYIEDNLALRLYETEWAVLTKIIGKRKYKSFSKKERFVAILFCVLYGLIIVLGIIMAVL